jgi:hypothetical protein
MTSRTMSSRAIGSRCNDGSADPEPWRSSPATVRGSWQRGEPCLREKVMSELSCSCWGLRSLPDAEPRQRASPTEARAREATTPRRGPAAARAPGDSAAAMVDSPARSAPAPAVALAAPRVAASTVTASPTRGPVPTTARAPATRCAWQARAFLTTTRASDRAASIPPASLRRTRERDPRTQAGGTRRRPRRLQHGQRSGLVAVGGMPRREMRRP